MSRAHKPLRLSLETLEDRSTPSMTVVNGHWVYENEVFDGKNGAAGGRAPLVVDGKADARWNNAVIRNCTFKNYRDPSDGTSTPALQIQGLRNLTVENCTFTNLEKGIYLAGGSAARSTFDVKILNNDITHCVYDGIMSHQSNDANNNILGDHTGLLIKGNYLSGFGETIEPSSTPPHGLYIKSSEYRIEDNTVCNSYAGGAISVRSTGVVARNAVWNTRDYAIRYVSNHVAGSSGRVLIENNKVIVNDSVGVGDNGGAIGMDDGGLPMANTYIVRFNSVVYNGANQTYYTYKKDHAAFDAKTVEVYANLFINTTGSGRYVGTGQIDYNEKNLTDTSTGHFVDFAAGNLHIRGTAVNGKNPRNSADGVKAWPATDKVGVARPSFKLDSGCYEYVATLEAAGRARFVGPLQELTAAGLASAAAAAKAQWAAAGADPAALAGVRFVIADLPGDVLGMTDGGTVTLDRFAAGCGWFVDLTAAADREFGRRGPSGVDLVTAVGHELGHVIGLPETAVGSDPVGTVMQETLEPGVRRTPTTADLAPLAEAGYFWGRHAR